MKIAVIGSRGINDIDIAPFIPNDVSVIISGGAKGVDTLAYKFAKQRGIETVIFDPDYSSFGKLAPLIRNKQIVNAAELIIAFWDGKSRGTKFTIDFANSQGKTVKIYFVDS